MPVPPLRATRTSSSVVGGTGHLPCHDRGARVSVQPADSPDGDRGREKTADRAVRKSFVSTRSSLLALSLFPLGLAGEDVGCVMEDHAPARPRALEHIGHEHGGDGDVPLELGEDVLRSRHPGEPPIHSHLDVRESESQLPAILEDRLPGLPNALPAGDKAPPGMDAAYVVGMPPHLILGMEIPALDGAIEAIVGLLDLRVLLVGRQLGHLTTSTPRSSSTTSDSRRAPGQGPSTQMPVACSKMAP